MPDDVVIRVENLSKQYRIGAREGYKTFRETLVDAAKAPFRAFKKLNPQSAIRNPQSETIWALRDVSFEVKQGEVVGIIGRNGAGKSTILKILSQITEPTEGRVELKGRIGSLLEVGTGFHPELTGHENVYLYGAILGMDRWEVTKKFDEIVAFAEIEKFIDTPVKKYSSGMYMRLAFAVAAHMETEILLVDEVLAVGDASFHKKCLDKMGDVSREGRTVLFVSHNMAAILGLCSRGICFSSGMILSDGEPQRIIEQYLESAKQRSEVVVPLAKSSDGKIALIGVNFLNNRGQQIGTIACGQDVVFCILVESKENIGRAKISIGIDNAIGVRISYLSNVLVGKIISLEDTRTIIRCRVPNLPLAPGNYTLSIKITGPTGVLIWSPNILSLEVVSGDFFKSGKMIEPPWVGSSLIPHVWEVERGK